MMDTEKALEFDKIKEQLEDFACTDGAKKRIQDMKPYLSETELAAALRETTEAKLMIERFGMPPATALQGIDAWVELAAAGGCLLPEQLETVAAVLAGVRRWKDYLKRGVSGEISIAYYEENLDALDEVRGELQQKVRDGRVDDHASAALKTLRERIERTDAGMREKAEQALRANKSYLSDGFYTMRSGHVCIPVKKEYKLKVGGSVLDKSATGSTLFIEPAAAGRLYEELQEWKLDEENEELRILYTLSGLLSDKEETIRENSRIVERLDFMFAKAKFSLSCGGVAPQINTGRYIALCKGRHPLMDRSVNVPLDFEIGRKNGEEIRGVVITGPNTGGKTVALKTVALNCMMAQCGLHVACESADICMNNAVLCDIGDGQDLSENLSTFSAHIKNVLDILRVVSHESLVIMDELGSGTDPAEGMGIAVAILEVLKKSGALFLVTTHYPEVKEYAKREQTIVNARMTFDRESLKPLYQMVIGEAGESCAFYIAGKLGMPEGMLRCAAKAAYGTDAEVGDISPVKELKRLPHPKLRRKPTAAVQAEALRFTRGDSVMVLPDRKIGIVCTTADEKGMLTVQLQGRKMQVAHKRLKLLVAAEQLYPEDYDFSIIFDSVAKRKAEHDMARKYVKETFHIENG